MIKCYYQIKFYKELQFDKKNQCNWPAKTKIWYKNEIIHRNDGPAIIIQNNYYEAWYHNGLLHREDCNKAAREWAGGYKEWWIKGKYIKSINTFN